MNIYNRRKDQGKGFTLIEILIVISIIVLITGITLASVKASKDKAADANTRKVISEVALKAEEQEIAPGVIDYSHAFTASSATTAIADLASTLKLQSSDYQYVSSPTGYAIVFPLKKGGYYCVDSLGHATGKEVTGLFADTGPQNCDTATRIVARPDGWDTYLFGGGGGGGGGGAANAPVIAAVGVDAYESQGMEGPGICSPDGCVVMYDHRDAHLTDPYYLANLLHLETETDPQITQYRIQTVFQIPWWAFTVTDVEDGVITNQLDYNDEPVFQAYTGPSNAAAAAIASYVNTTVQHGLTHYSVSDCEASYYQIDFFANDSDGNSTEKPYKVYSCVIGNNG